MITKEIKPQSLLNKRNKVKGQDSESKQGETQLYDCFQWFSFSNNEYVFVLQQ